MSFAVISRHGASPAAGPPHEDDRRADSLRLVLPAMTAWGTALILLGCPVRAGVITAGAAGLGAVMVTAAAWWRARGAEHSAWLGTWARSAVAVLGCVAAAAVAVAFRVESITTGPIAEGARAGASVTAQIVITDDPRVLPAHGAAFGGERVVTRATVEVIETAAGRMAVDSPVVVFGSGARWKELLPSQRLSVHGRLAPADQAELTAAILLVRGPPKALSPPSGVQRVAGTLRAGLRTAAEPLPPDQRGLLPGLVVGDVSRMDEQVKADFAAAGLSHLTAVSGANLAIVAGAAIALGRAGGMPLAVRAALAVASMLAFTVVARPSESVLRALLMGMVAAIALGTGRSRDGVAALSGTVLLLILFDPSLARSYGFALSVWATAGILFLAPRWRDRMAGRLPIWLSEAIAIPAAAQAAVTPVLVLMSGQITLSAIPANLLAGPAVAPATLLGFAAALIAPLHMEVARLIVWPAGLVTGWIIGVAGHAAALPLGVVPWPGGLAGLALLAVAAIAILVLLRHPLGRRAGLALAGGALAAILVIGPAVSSWPPGRWLLVACDVGQGDALVIAAGTGRGVVVDTGSDPRLVDRCLRDLGVREVPLLILTHPHFDHTGGMAGVFRGRRVAGVVVGSEGDASPAVRRISGDIARHGATERLAVPGTRWRFGPSEVTVLAPYGDAVPAGPGEGSVVNNASVVLHVRWAAGSALLSGDMETEAQADLLRRGFPRVEILKIPHHGSARQDPAFVAATGARAGLISVGSGNDYGHPAPATLSLLAWHGIRIYRTDRSGDLAVIDDQGRLAILSRGQNDD
ncbi:ComEC/Rec2 family competence protein [Streptosporangium soli]|nr:ComEC/Rec2 family competence protein [Streptosporangium sp. KLBMP 9127]